MNYDAWFDYLRLLEADGDAEQIREVYERAIANLPPSQVNVILFIIIFSVHFNHYLLLWLIFYFLIKTAEMNLLSIVILLSSVIYSVMYMANIRIVASVCFKDTSITDS